MEGEKENNDKYLRERDDERDGREGERMRDGVRGMMEERGENEGEGGCVHVFLRIWFNIYQEST